MKKMFAFKFIFLCLSVVFIQNYAAIAEEASSKIQKDCISTQEQGEECFAEARKLLSTLGITIPRQILLKVRPKDEVQTHLANAGGRSVSVGGYYQPYDPEQIWIVSGQSRNQTISDMSHELAHAWQSTECPLQDRTIKEGFAVWCEYKVLFMLGEKELAKQLALREDPDYGGGLRLFLKVEKEGGVAAVLEYAKKTKKPPKGYDDEFKQGK